MCSWWTTMSTTKVVCDLFVAKNSENILLKFWLRKTEFKRKFKKYVNFRFTVWKLAVELRSTCYAEFWRLGRHFMKAFVLLKLSSTYLGSGCYIFVLIYTALIESFLLVSLRLVEKCANLKWSDGHVWKRRKIWKCFHMHKLNLTETAKRNW